MGSEEGWVRHSDTENVVLVFCAFPQLGIEL